MTTLQPPPPAALLAACRRLLRPLVRFMMRSGVTFPVLTDVLRHLFVDVAVSDFLTQSKTRTDSRISLLTGIHRKDIKHFREIAPDRLAVPEVVTVASRIIARWLGSAPFIDDAGKPRPLPRIAEVGVEGISFDALVCSVTSDIRSRTVLDDWLSQGLVRMTTEDHVVLSANAFIPRPGGAEQLFYFARNLHDHVSAAVAKISTTEVAPFLDRSVHYDELTPDQACELEAFARGAAVQALLAVNRKALGLVEANPPEGQPLCRVNFGVFVFRDSDSPTPDGPIQGGGAAE